MSNSGEGSETHPRRPCGLGMVEMLAVVVILVLLFFALRPQFHGRRPARMRATWGSLCALKMALKAYCNEFGAYPPPTGFVAVDGTTTPFAAGEATESDSLYCHLCRPMVVGGRTVGPFLSVNQRQVVAASPPSGPTWILVDPFGHPFRYDIVKDAQGNLHPRVWSIGPDGKEGPVPFSRVQTITDPRDEDNIGRY